MKDLKVFVLILTLLAMAASQGSFAQSKAGYLKIDGVEGESTDDKHKMEIDVLSFSSTQTTQTKTSNPPIAYLKLDGIDGESKDDGHKDWIIIESMRVNSSNDSQRRGEVILEDIVVTKELDKSSRKLAEAAKNQTIIPRALIVLYKDGKPSNDLKKASDYYTVKLTNVLVTSYSYAAGDPLPTEEVTLGFSDIQFDAIMIDE